MSERCVTSVWQRKEKQMAHVKLTTTFYFLKVFSAVTLQSEMRRGRKHKLKFNLFCIKREKHTVLHNLNVKQIFIHSVQNE